MTNKEWLFTLNDKALGEFLCGEDFQRLKMAYTNSALGIAEWLSMNHNKSYTAYELYEKISRGEL